MDFSSIESAVYGDLENDEDLMKELLALEAEERGTKQGATASTKSPRSGQVKKQQHTSYPLPVSHATNTGATALTPADLAKAMADISDSDILDDDDEGIDDPELLDELSNLVEEECGGAAKELPALSAPPATVNTALLQKLHHLANDYASAIVRSEGNAPRIRRLQRGLNQIKDLTEKVEMGRSINEDEIPPAIFPAASATANQKLGTPESPGLAKTAEKSDGYVSPVRQAPAPPLPPRRSDHSSTVASSASVSHFGSSMPEQEECAKTKDSPNPQKQLATVKNQPIDNSSSEGKVGGPRVLNVEEIMTLLSARRESYIRNAQVANAAGDKKAAYEYYTVVKQFDEAIEAVKSGQVTECSEDELPPAPESYKPPKKAAVPPSPKTLLEGLQQRLARYKELCEQNKQEHNDRKYRMNSRIVKQYEDAIRAHQSKRPVNLEELPCPPGYPALPVAEVQPLRTNAEPLPLSHSPVVSGGQPGARTGRVHQVGPLAPVLQHSSGQIQSRQNQQLEFLLKRQLQFKQAAVMAKNKNDMALAKKYLLAAKGFDQMIEASRAGLPVDIKKAPIPPQMQTSEQMLKPSLGPKSSLDCSAVVEGSREDVFKELERDLIKQIRMCEENRLAFTKLGDVTRVNQFEKWSSDSKKDLICLRQMAKDGSSLPKVKFETRVFPSVDVCPEINEDHLELRIVRVLNVKLPSGSREPSLLCFAPYWRSSPRRKRRNRVQSWKPSDGNIFVKYEFTFPHDSHQNGKTKIIYGTNSPDFNEKFLLSINRKSRQLQRVIRRNCIKFEVYQKGGFLRSDRLLGSADCKLVALEAKARLHESVDLVEGRKPTGGKLEYEVRVREPLGETKLNFTEEKWLVLES